MQTLQAPVPGQHTSHATATAHHAAAVGVGARGEPGAAAAAAAILGAVRAAGLAGALLGPHAAGGAGEPRARRGCGGAGAALCGALPGRPHLAAPPELCAAARAASRLAAMHPDIIGVR